MANEYSMTIIEIELKEMLINMKQKGIVQENGCGIIFLKIIIILF